MHVTRQRRSRSRGRLGLSDRAGRLGLVAAGTAAVLVAGAGMAYATTRVFGHHEVGTQYRNGLQVSDDQMIKPIGSRLLTKFGKIMGSTVSPDGHFLAATSTDKSVVLQIFDLSTYRLIWTVGSAPFVNQQLADGSVGQEGPTYSPDGKFLWLPETDGLTRFPVKDDGTLGDPTAVPLPKVNELSALPGKGVYSADGRTLYVPANGQNTVLALDPTTGDVEHTWDVGIAPREVVLVGDKLYVSNEGGRRALPGETTINSYGTQVPANAFLGTSTTGTVSVIDTARPSARGPVHRRRAAPDRAVRRPQGAVRRQHQRRHRLGDQHQAGPGRADDRHATLAVVHGGLRADRDRVDRGRSPAGHPRPRERRRRLPLLGPPAGAGELPRACCPRTTTRPTSRPSGGQVVVTNTRGIDARGPELTFNKGPGTAPATGHGTHSTTASLTRFTAAGRRRDRPLHLAGLRPERLDRQGRPAGPGEEGEARRGPAAPR